MRKKLIEVALPLEAINEASAREKSIRHGHPSTLHLWWARRPLAAARAVIFSQMVDDPSSCPEEFPTEEAQDKERQRLFRLIEELVKWENTTNEKVLQRARDEIWKSWRRTCRDNKDHPQADELFNPDKLPAFHDPFAGGGALPLEAQRLGLEAYASDLNPVAVLINKAMIEIPPKFANMPPVNPEARAKKSLIEKEWKGAEGLAEDVRYYGQWMRDEAEKRIGHLYPKVKITEDLVKERPDLEKYLGQELTVIAWLWARTVKSPNPAFSDVNIPLVSNFMLSADKGKEAYVEPIVGHDSYRFAVKVGKPNNTEEVKKGTAVGRRTAFRCLMSGTPVSYEYIRSEGQAKRLGAVLMTIVAEGDRERLYLPPVDEHSTLAKKISPSWEPETLLHGKCRVNVSNYGFNTFADLYTPRQITVLSALADLVAESCDLVVRDAISSELANDDIPLEQGGNGIRSYSDAIAVYLAIAIDKMADYCSTICTWNVNRAGVRNTFGRQAIPMSWDYAEVNSLSNSTGNFSSGLNWIGKVLDKLPVNTIGVACQENAASQTIGINKIVSTDPPYYDNICYADLSDYFYVWIRKSLSKVFPNAFLTIAVPKSEELVATPYLHDSKKEAEEYFLDGMSDVMHQLALQTHCAFPVTIYYAFKQVDTNTANGLFSTGWETFLAAIIASGFCISGTWPIRTERSVRSIAINKNALASSIVLVCRKSDELPEIATRRSFIADLRKELEKALLLLQEQNIAPVDLAQAALGPGMSVFTRYSEVLDSLGESMVVHEALTLINQTLDEVMSDQEGSFDSESRWAIAWFDHVGFEQGEYGVAETLSKAKNTSVENIANFGVLESKHGKVRLLRPSELSELWNPSAPGLTAWEIVHHLIRSLETSGESDAAGLVNKLGAKADEARELAYRLYTICERKKRAAEALSYNALVQSWPEIVRLAKEVSKPLSSQGNLFDSGKE